MNFFDPRGERRIRVPPSERSLPTLFGRRMAGKFSRCNDSEKRAQRKNPFAEVEILYHILLCVSRVFFIFSHFLSSSPFTHKKTPPLSYIGSYIGFPFSPQTKREPKQAALSRQTNPKSEHPKPRARKRIGTARYPFPTESSFKSNKIQNSDELCNRFLILIPENVCKKSNIICKKGHCIFYF